MEEYTDTFQPELACKFAERALELEPDNTQVLDTLAPVLLEIGDADKAMEISFHIFFLGHEKSICDLSFFNINSLLQEVYCTEP